jgi:hypothetical protein
MSGCKGEFFGPGTSDYNYKLSGNYKLFHAGETYILKGDGMTKVVEGNLIGITWDNNFILVEQEKDESIIYWIIDAKEDKRYGDFNKSEFEEKKNKLKVNAQLKFEKPEKYKYLEEPIKK